MNTIRKINGNARSQRGQGMTEYIIIVALIAIATITVASLFGGTVRNQMAGMAQELSGQSGKVAIQQAQKAATKAETEANKHRKMDGYTNP